MKTNLPLTWSQLLLLPFICLFLGCGMAAPEVAEVENLPNRRRLTRAAMRAPDWKIVICVDQSDSALTTAINELIAARPFDKDLSWASCDTMDTQALGQQHLLFFGNRLPAGAASLPAQPQGTTGFQFQETIFPISENQSGTGLAPRFQLSYYLNPWSSEDNQQLLNFWYAPDAASLGDFIKTRFRESWESVFWPNWAYELVAEDERRMGNYRDSSWAFDAAGAFVLKQNAQPVSTNDYWEFKAIDGELDLSIETRVREHLRTRTANLNVAIPDQPIPVYIYPTVERIGLHTGRMDTAFVEVDEAALHIVANEMTYGERSAEASYLLLRDSILGWRQNENLAWGMARYYSPEREQLLKYMVPLHEMGILRDLGEVYQNENPEEGRSRLYLALEQLAMVFPYMERGKNSDISTLDNIELSIIGIEDSQYHEAELRQSIEKYGYTESTKVAHTTSGPQVSLTQKGMTLAHEGYRIYNGYGGSTIGPSLAALAEINTNSIAVVPYSFMRSPQGLDRIPVSTSAGGENDHACMASAKAAHQRGWTVLLKPQIWLGGGHWPGDIDQDTEEGWEQFFDNYEQWILHYAVLADRHNIETFCIGTEMRYTTLKQPERWRELIAKARRLFRGRLTYAANWGEEMEQMTFWPDFDVIGLNAYYPLVEGEEAEATEEALSAGAHRWLERVENIAAAANRELWLTEVGFRSVADAWRNPHASAADRPADQACQERCFGALLDAIEERQSIGGIYVWKWPSHLTHSEGQGDRGFTPYGKPAAELLKEFYE